TRVAAGHSVLGRVLLDSAAFLVASNAVPRRLFGGLGAHAPLGGDLCDGRTSNRGIHVGNGADLPRAVADRAHGLVLYRSRRRPGHRGPRRGVPSKSTGTSNRRAGGAQAHAVVPFFHRISGITVRRGCRGSLRLSAADFLTGPGVSASSAEVALRQNH